MQPPPPGGPAAPRELTFPGFTELLTRQIVDSCEYPWGVLRAFRYALGPHDGEGGPLVLQPAPPCALPPRARTALSRPPALRDGSVDPARCAVGEVLRHDPTGETGLGFVAGLFARFASAAPGGQPALTPDDAAAVFAACAGGRHPFGELWPFCGPHRRDGSLGWADWLQLWAMLAAAQPAGAAQALYELGFATVAPGSRRLSLAPGPALAVGRERHAGLREVAARAGGGYALLDDAAWDVGRIAVVGSQGSGKTTAILKAVGADMPGRYAAHLSAAGAGGEGGARVHTRPTTRPTHYVRPMPPPAAAGGEGGAAPSPATADSDLAEPRTLVFTVRAGGRWRGGEGQVVG